jgi:hypothetical protein
MPGAKTVAPGSNFAATQTPVAVSPASWARPTDIQRNGGADPDERPIKAINLIADLAFVVAVLAGGVRLEIGAIFQMILRLT